jgi:acetylornithine deacetylase/succinyl-diaminopimelate desuccinylase-like protein
VTLDRGLLLRLLAVDTASQLETGECSDGLWQAQRVYATAAAELGFTVVRHAAPDAAAVTGAEIPATVRRAVAAHPQFLATQPSLVLRLGPERHPGRTVMFNVHLDTVAGVEPVREEPGCGELGRIHGRGAVDAKGPAVALLAGVRAALAAEPGLTDRITVLIQAVAGEEGGAMGVFGTRLLVRDGFTGWINLFCEPTGGRLLDHCTAAMTACIEVSGEDAIDDRPGAGHNATVLLGYLAQHLGAVLPGVCVAGLHTGDSHNKVYGRGRLLLNLPYDSPEAGRALAAATERAVEDGLADFQKAFQDVPGLARTAADATAVTRLEWLKRDLPALTPGNDPAARALLEERAGLPRWPAGEPGFTCDAIWMQGVPGAYTAVFGPGDLAANRAHAPGEYVEVADLERYAAAIGRVLVQFSRSES